MNSRNIYLRYLEIKDAQSLLDLRLKNRDFYQVFEPIRDEFHYTLEGQEKEIVTRINAMTNDEAYTYGIFLEETDELVGRISLTGVIRGPLQHANIGYYIDQKYNYKGYATNEGRHLMFGNSI